MAIPTVGVFIRLFEIVGTPLPRARVIFNLARSDIVVGTDGGIVPSGQTIVTVDDFGEALPQLFPNALGTNRTQYGIQIYTEEGAQVFPEDEGAFALTSIPNIDGVLLHSILFNVPALTGVDADAYLQAAQLAAGRAEAAEDATRVMLDQATGIIADATAQALAAETQANRADAAANFAEDQVTLAANQVALAAGQVALATEQVGFAADQVALATDAANAASGFATTASNAADAAILARDAAQGFAGAAADSADLAAANAASASRLRTAAVFYDTDPLPWVIAECDGLDPFAFVNGVMWPIVADNFVVTPDTSGNVAIMPMPGVITTSDGTTWAAFAYLRSV